MFDPFLQRPSRHASDRPSGIVAAVVFPYFSMLCTTFAGDRQLRLLEHLARDLRHLLRRPAEDLLPVHRRVVLPLVDHLLRHPRDVVRRGRLEPQILRAGSVGVQRDRLQPLTLVGRCADDRRSRAVAEEHRDVAPAIGELDTGRVHLRADQEDVAIHPGAYPRVGDRESIQEPGALVAHVERGNARQPELVTEETPRAGEVVIR